MIATKRVSLVLLIYFLCAGALLTLPVFLIWQKGLVHRFEILAVFYVAVFFFFVIRSFLLGGGLDIRLTTQVNQVYGAKLQLCQSCFLDLHCMSLLRVAGVWLVFPTAWLSRIIEESDMFHLYELSLDTYLPELARDQEKINTAVALPVVTG